jgi:Tol biopolymer transport system component
MPENCSVRSWSPDGKRIAYCHFFGADQSENGIVDVESGQITKFSLAQGDVVDDWAPEGDVLSVIARNLGKRYYRPDGETYALRGLYMVKADGPKFRPITHDPDGDFINSRFSPDGNKIAYQHRYHVDGHTFYAAAVANRDGSNERDIVNFTKLEYGLKPNRGPCWSTDGQTIIFTAMPDHPGHDDFELIEMNADGSDVRRMPLSKERSWWGCFDFR